MANNKAVKTATKVIFTKQLYTPLDSNIVTTDPEFPKLFVKQIQILPNGVSITTKLDKVIFVPYNNVLMLEE